MNVLRHIPIALLFVALIWPPFTHAGPLLSWSQALRQEADWYASPEAIRIAARVLQHQHKSGGWPKNVTWAAAHIPTPSLNSHPTIDNGATYTEMRYLARVFAATDDGRYARAFLRGLDYLLEAQYENGGWPQYYPLRGGYHDAITFNDDAMIGVMDLLRDIVYGQSPFTFIDSRRKELAGEALKKGVNLIVRAQIQVDGIPTAWCAQHDPHDLSPTQGRSYEHPSISGSESAEIVRFLLSLAPPAPEVVASIEHAMEWFEAVQIRDIRVVDVEADGQRDRIVQTAPGEGPLWARFYEIGTNRPIFSGRDGMIKYELAEIEHERRIGYRWYGNWGKDLLEEAYPAWKQTWLHDRHLEFP